MRIKNYKILCFILVIFIVLSGMCIENIEADSSFAYAPMEETNSYIMTDDAVISQAEPCTTEMLGVRNNAGIQRLASQFINQKRESKVSLSFLYSNIFFLYEKERRFLISSKAITFCNQCQDELVVNYIHKSDGKKESNEFPVFAYVTIGLFEYLKFNKKKFACYTRFCVLLMEDIDMIENIFVGIMFMIVVAAGICRTSGRIL